MPRTPARSPTRPDPAALPDPLQLPWQSPAPGPSGHPSGRTPPADPRAESGWAAGLPEASAADRRLIEAQLGREVRGSVAVATRCRYGLPAVVRTAPLLDDGTPFPTLYWLACPAARVAVGRLEAAGWNARLSDRVATDPALAEAHAAAHAGYLAQRDAMAHLPGDPGVGGLPGRVKCLHALYAHQAATGANPVGRIVSQTVDPIDCPGPCVDPAPSPPTPDPLAVDPRAAAPPTPDPPTPDPPAPARRAGDPPRSVPGPPVGERSRSPESGVSTVHSPSPGSGGSAGHSPSPGSGGSAGHSPGG